MGAQEDYAAWVGKKNQWGKGGMSGDQLGYGQYIDDPNSGADLKAEGFRQSQLAGMNSAYKPTMSLEGLKIASNPTGAPMAAAPPTQVPITAPPDGKLAGGDPSRIAGPQTTATTQQQPLAASPLAAPILTAGAGPAAQQPITAATPLPSAPAPTALRAPAATSKYRSKASLGGLKRAARR